MQMKQSKQNRLPAPGFGEWLKRQRLQHKPPLTVQQLAELASTSDTTVRDLEHNRAGKIALETILKLSDALGIDLGYMLHKYGAMRGRDPLDPSRVRRAEAAAEALELFEGVGRQALAEAANALSDDPRPFDRSQVREYVRDALVLLDVGASMMRADGWVNHVPEPIPVQERPVPIEAKPKSWSPQELRFLEQNGHLKDRAIAAALGRTTDSVRNKRRSLQSRSKHTTGATQ
jgi:transcriptional regulator with XRE-family HTH domain